MTNAQVAAEFGEDVRQLAGAYALTLDSRDPACPYVTRAVRRLQAAGDRLRELAAEFARGVDGDLIALTDEQYDAFVAMRTEIERARQMLAEGGR